MKNKAVTRLLKQIAQALASVTKAKPLALNLKGKMSDIRALALNLKGKISDIRAQMTIFYLLYLDKRSRLGPIRFNNLRISLSHRHSLHQEPTKRGNDQYKIKNKANMVLSSILEEATVAAKQEEEEEDLPQLLLEELEFDDHDVGKSAKEMVENSIEVEEGEDSRVDDRIDEVAEMFITRFYNQLRMQKQDSFKSLSRQDSFKSCLSKQNSFKSCLSSPVPPQQMHQTS